MGRSCRVTNVGGGKGVKALRNHNHDWNNGIEIDLNMRSYFYPTNTARSSHPKSVLIASIVNGDCGLRIRGRTMCIRSLPLLTIVAAKCGIS